MNHEISKIASKNTWWFKKHQIHRDVHLVESFGFKLNRTDGSHHIFSRPGIPELVNLQDVEGQAKPYQIRQFLRPVEKQDIKLEDE